MEKLLTWISYCWQDTQQTLSISASHILSVDHFEGYTFSFKVLCLLFLDLWEYGQRVSTSCAWEGSVSCWLVLCLWTDTIFQIIRWYLLFPVVFWCSVFEQMGWFDLESTETRRVLEGMCVFHYGVWKATEQRWETQRKSKLALCRLASIVASAAILTFRGVLSLCLWKRL